MWVFDATPLIYPAKADVLVLLEQFDQPLEIPERVYEEVVTEGLERGYPDARRIEQCVEDGIFDVVGVPETDLAIRLRDNPNLSEADVAVLTRATISGGIAVMDETYGRDVASTEGITTRGTAFLVLSLVDRGTLDTETARTVIDEMVDEGWYCAPNVYARIVATLDSLDE